MASDERTTQAQLTPEERRGLLRAFADRMLLKITAMDDPEDMPGVERAVRVAAVIERVYSRCDRAERQRHIEAPDLFKAEAECATHKSAAIKARVTLANMLEWEDKRRRDLGPWWDAAEKATHSTTLGQMPASQPPAASAHVTVAPNEQPAKPTQTPVSHALKSDTSGRSPPSPDVTKTDLAKPAPQIRSAQASGP